MTNTRYSPGAKQSTIDALEKGIKRQSKQLDTSAKRGTYKKPEKITEKECMAWCRKQGFSMEIIDASGAYKNAYGAIPVKAGFSDSVGVMSNGTAVFLEWKARDRRSQAKDHQIAFLKEKIEHNAFAAVVDSVEYLEWLYHQWLGSTNRVQLLLDALPKRRLRKEELGPLF